MSQNTIILASQSEVENLVTRMVHDGWKALPSRVPLLGQEGFVCVNEVSKEERRIFWNLFRTPLRPIPTPCQGDRSLLDFIWQHHKHDMSFFEVQTGECGLVCYCNSKNGRSNVMIVTEKEQELLSEAGWETLCKLSPNRSKGTL